MKFKLLESTYPKYLYRVGSTTPDVFEHSDGGLFFTSDLNYYDEQGVLGYNKEEAKRYILSPNARIWDPVNELDLNTNNWDYISGKLTDFEKYNIPDECTWEIEDGWGVTSTDGLAIVGKKLGYDGTVMRHIPSNGGWGKDYDEYVIYNPNVVREA